METEFIPAHPNVDNRAKIVLSMLCHGKAPFEELISHWVQIGKSLTFTHSPEPNSKHLVAVLETTERAEFYGNIPIGELKKIYPGHIPLKEEVYTYADQEGHTADHEWFEQRNKKLGIKWCERHENWLLPPRSLGNIVLSYALSSAGMVRIEKSLIEDSHYRFVNIYRVFPVFFGEDFRETQEDRGWHEELILVEPQLKRHLERRRGSGKKG